LPSLLAGLSQGRRISLSAGNQVRDFVYVDDVVEAFVRSDAEMQMPDTPLTAIWNVCTGVENSVKCFASTVARIVGASEELLGFGDIPLRPDDDPWLVGNGELLHQALSWRPAYNLSSGLSAAIEKYAVGKFPAEDLECNHFARQGD
jgi:nucleoside-diphosphate-sugar epimerase